MNLHPVFLRWQIFLPRSFLTNQAILPAALIATLWYGESCASNQVTGLIYKQACHQGVTTSMDVLPSVPDKDGMRTRGYNGCEGSLQRLQKSGDLAKENDLVGFACGYSVGAMFAKYGLQSEVNPMSERATKALQKCVDETKRQIKNIK